MSPRTLSEKKHLCILEAATSEFRIRGFQGTSMDRISESAGVSKRTVYNHFPSKDDLFRATIAEVWTQAHEATERPYRPELPVDEQLLEIARSEIRLLAQEEFLELTRALLTAFMQNPEMARSKLEELHQRDKGIVTFIRAAIDDGALKPVDPEIAGHQFLGLIKTFAFWPQIMMDQPVLDTEAAEVVVTSALEVFLAAYRS